MLCNSNGGRDVFFGEGMLTFWSILLVINGPELTDWHAADEHHGSSLNEALVLHVPSSTLKIKATHVNTFFRSGGDIALRDSEYIEVPTECVDANAVASGRRLHDGRQEPGRECKGTDPEGLRRLCRL